MPVSITSNSYCPTAAFPSPAPDHTHRHRAEPLVFGFLRHDVDVHGGRFTQEAVHRREIEVLPPITHRSSTKDYLSDVLRTDKIRYRIRNTFPFQANHLSAETFREAQVGCKSVLIGPFGANPAVNVNDI